MRVSLREPRWDNREAVALVSPDVLSYPVGNNEIRACVYRHSHWRCSYPTSSGSNARDCIKRRACRRPGAYGRRLSKRRYTYEEKFRGGDSVIMWRFNVGIIELLFVGCVVIGEFRFSSDGFIDAVTWDGTVRVNVWSIFEWIF